MFDSVRFTKKLNHFTSLDYYTKYFNLSQTNNLFYWCINITMNIVFRIMIMSTLLFKPMGQ